ncbi:MAG: DUF2839 family protein [Arthrospira sp. PLM2.Bin9]|nr:DUF2839 domain-containing protein [Arthrospira sp. PLM2.Bin9]TVU54725.1 MAG: DUF2839 family protein [Arthrospira sp. PLM2.Bin9]
MVTSWLSLTILPLVPITKTQSEQFMQWTTKGAWFGISFLVIFWLTIRLVGPALGWWTVD